MQWGWKTLLSAAVIAVMAGLKALGFDTSGLEGTTGVATSWVDIIQQLAVAFGLFGLRDAVRKK